jgi:hypothetical protein
MDKNNAFYNFSRLAFQTYVTYATYVRSVCVKRSIRIHQQNNIILHNSTESIMSFSEDTAYVWQDRELRFDACMLFSQHLCLSSHARIFILELTNRSFIMMSPHVSRFDSSEAALQCRPGERLIDSINSVEDTKGANLRCV